MHNDSSVLYTEYHPLYPNGLHEKNDFLTRPRYHLVSSLHVLPGTLVVHAWFTRFFCDSGLGSNLAFEETLQRCILWSGMGAIGLTIWEITGIQIRCHVIVYLLHALITGVNIEFLRR